MLYIYNFKIKKNNIMAIIRNSYCGNVVIFSMYTDFE